MLRRSKFYAHMKVKRRRSTEWFLIIVYSSPHLHNHEGLWDDMCDISYKTDGP